MKSLMLDYIFQYLDSVIFHIGADNTRSQKAIEWLNAVKTGEVEMPYQVDPNANLNFVYEITKTAPFL